MENTRDERRRRGRISGGEERCGEAQSDGRRAAGDVPGEPLRTNYQQLDASFKKKTGQRQQQRRYQGADHRDFRRGPRGDNGTRQVATDNKGSNFLTGVIVLLSICSALTSVTAQTAFDCGNRQKLAIVANMSLEYSIKSLSTTLPLIANISVGSHEMATFIINNLLTEGIFHAIMQSYALRGHVYVLLNGMIYHVVCPSVKVFEVNTERCYEDTLVSTYDGRRAFLQSGTGILLSSSRQILCQTENSNYDKIAKKIDSFSMVRTSNKILGLALFKNERVFVDSSRLFNPHAARKLVDLEEDSLDEGFSVLTKFIRRHGAKLSIAYVVAYMCVALSVVCFAWIKGIKFTKSLALVYTPCKIYHDYHKYKHEADQERVTAEVKMVEDKNSPQDTTEEIESILTTLEAIVIRLEMLESRPTYLPSKRLLALNN